MKKQKKQNLLTAIIIILVITLIMMVGSIVYEEITNMSKYSMENAGAPAIEIEDDANDMTTDEERTFRYMVERNAINYGFREFEFHNLENVNQLEEMEL